MKVCFIGKHKHLPKILSNQQDSQVWLSLGRHFKNVFVLSESVNFKPNFDQVENVKLYNLTKLGYPFFIIQAVSVGLYLNFKYGIDYFDASEVLGGGSAAFILGFITGKPFIQEIQGEIFNLPKWEPWVKRKLLRFFGRFLVRQAYKVRANSFKVRQQVISQGVVPDKVFLVPLRVDLDVFEPSRFNIEELKSKLGLKNKITIGFLGRLAPEKGLFDVLTMFQMLNEKFSDLALLIFGDGPLAEELKDKARNLGVSEAVKFMGFVNYDQVPASLALIDIFIHPSLHEGFGRSILEAQAMAKPVVATKVGGIPDLVLDGQNGFLVDPNEPNQLVEKVGILISDPDLRQKIGASGRDWVKKNFEWHKGIERFANIFTCELPE